MDSLPIQKDAVQNDPAGIHRKSAINRVEKAHRSTPPRNLTAFSSKATSFPLEPQRRMDKSLESFTPETLKPKTQKTNPLLKDKPDRDRFISRRSPLAIKRVLPRLNPMTPPEEEKRSAISNLTLPERGLIKKQEQPISPFEHDTPLTYHGLELSSRKVIFCLDVSLSMQWNNRIGEAREELLRLLDTLDETVSFNIVTFSGRVRIWNREGVQPGSTDNVESAKRFVRGARIRSDGTNTVDALTAALSDEDVKSIYFLSDGHPTAGFTTDSDRILRHVKKLQNNRKVKIHTIAYIKGLPPPQYRSTTPPKNRLIDLMKRLAEQNNGNYVVFDT
jgi:hypothetical protein